MNFLIDADLPRSTATTLAAGGHDALHVSDVGLGAGADRAIFNHAQQTEAVLVTRDLDFTDPLKFPESSHCGLMIVRIRETLPPSFANRAILEVAVELDDEQFPNAVIIVEENRFRRRRLQTGSTE